MNWAVVTDLDGTVVREDGTVTEGTLRAAEGLREQGVPLIAATARSPLGVEVLRPLVPHLSFAVCSSGAVGYVPATRELAWVEPLPGGAVAKLVDWLSVTMPAAGAAAFDGYTWRLTPNYHGMRPSTHNGQVTVVPAAALSEVNACLMVVGHPGLRAPDLAAALAGVADVTLAYAGRRFVEVTAPSVDKASGVTRALRTVGAAPADSIAFGDMPIDIPMFSVVGHSVAMAGAPPEVLAAATHRTESVEEDGFARMLSRMLDFLR